MGKKQEKITKQTIGVGGGGGAAEPSAPSSSATHVLEFTKLRTLCNLFCLPKGSKDKNLFYIDKI